MSHHDQSPAPSPSPAPFQGDPAQQATSAAVRAQVRAWVEESSHLPTPRQARMLADVLKDPAGLEFTVGFVDRVVRPEDPAAAATHLRTLATDPPAFLPAAMRPLLAVGSASSRALPRPVIATAQAAMRSMVGHLILDARDPHFARALARYRKAGVQLNVNLLGEAVLGAKEAGKRLAGVRFLIERPDVDYCSIKVSSIVDHMSLWGAKETVEIIVERLLPLYRLAATQARPTFINLDMEEFKDLELTVEVFERLLRRDELRTLYAGLVLQAYLPDAERMMERVQRFAAARVERGGAPVKVRLVKGANLALERVDASLHEWPLATFGSKLETDAHYKRVLREALTPEHLSAVHLGIAGHNLFDIAYAYQLMQERGIPVARRGEAAPQVEFEMLAGMAPAQQEVISRSVGPIRLYVPVVSPKEFDVAVSYLVRRLEENASSENFMSALMELEEREDLFAREAERFDRALAESLARGADTTHRTGDRGAEANGEITLGSPTLPARPGRFVNTPDTDVSTAANQEWAAGVRERISASTLGLAEADAARLESVQEVQDAIASCLEGQRAWDTAGAKERARILRDVAVHLAHHRGALLEVAASETGKMLEQGDAEVSEAIDFALYYADSIEALASRTDVVLEARPLTLVTPPWNFPIAIPCGSILAALATGSAVIVKPAPQARRTGAYLVRLLHEAGIPRDVLRLVDVPENEVGRALIADTRVDQIILTGAYETAQLFASFNPTTAIKAETSGKNAIIVTPHADLDLAVKDIVASAFGHAGQKCSAASLIVTVGSVSTSRRFHAQLADAVLSLDVGHPTSPRATVGPVIEEPEGKLKRGLSVLGPGESWLSRPRALDATGRLFFPGLRAGVKEGSEFHLTEYFGPVAGLMHADTLEDAIRMVNGTDYGLTSGLHSLDEAEIETWLDAIQAGNLYVNRGITGAIVQRQPFGGWKRSAIGQTAKAGGPNYLVHLMDVHDVDPGAARTDAWLRSAMDSDTGEWRGFFAPRDIQGLHGEINVLRYRPASVVVRAAAGAHPRDVERVLHAAQVAGVRSEVSVADADAGVAARAAGLTVIHEDAARFASRLSALAVDRVRAIGGVEPELREAIVQRPEVALFDRPVVASGRIELLTFVREQAVSATNHRYGNPLPYGLAQLITGLGAR
ncbi:MAG: proline dehydrogenase family protein [Dermabacter sp.]|nr:proline dehydrogenase family protein [Dermabacter sp.]